MTSAGDAVGRAVVRVSRERASDVLAVDRFPLDRARTSPARPLAGSRKVLSARRGRGVCLSMARALRSGAPGVAAPRRTSRGQGLRWAS